jgi:YVTN family beta-propeller protein
MQPQLNIQKITLTHLSTLWITVITLVISATILLNQITDAQNVGESSLHSKTYEEVAIQTGTSEKIPSIKVDRSPRVMVLESNPFNPTKIYVSNMESNTISVLGGINNTNIDTIRVGPSNNLLLVGFNQFAPLGLIDMVISNGKIYMSDLGTNKISVIDEKNYSNITKIEVGSGINKIDVWPHGGGLMNYPKYVYVASSGSSVITEIDGNNYTNIRDISINSTNARFVKPSDMTLLPSKENDPTGTLEPRIIIVDNMIGNLSVIEASKCKNVNVSERFRNNRECATTNIPVPIGTHTLSNFLDKILVSNFNTETSNNTISIIDGKNYSNITTVKVGKQPLFMYSPINTPPILSNDRNIEDGSSNKIYVANYIDDTVSVIDGKNYSNVTTIKVGDGPNYIIWNHFTDTIYVSNALSNSITVIDGVTDKVVAGLTFSVNPNNSGDIVCNNLTVPTPLNQYFYLFSGSTCIAMPHKGFEFQNWQENLEGHSTQLVRSSNPSPTTIYDYVTSFSDSSVKFFGIESYIEDISKSLGIELPKDEGALDITKFGNFTANFSELPPSVPTAYWASLFTIVATALIGSLLIPWAVQWLKSRKETSRLNSFHKQMVIIYADRKLDYDDMGQLNTIFKNISDSYTSGKINNEQFNSLKNEISIAFQEIYRRKIGLFKVEGKNLDEELEKTENQISDAYSKGKLDELHYSSLKNEISLLYESVYKERIESLPSENGNLQEKLKKIEKDIMDAHATDRLSELHYNLLNKRIQELKTDDNKK